MNSQMLQKQALIGEQENGRSTYDHKGLDGKVEVQKTIHLRKTCHNNGLVLL